MQHATIVLGWGLGTESVARAFYSPQIVEARSCAGKLLVFTLPSFECSLL